MACAAFVPWVGFYLLLTLLPEPTLDRISSWTMSEHLLLSRTRCIFSHSPAWRGWRHAAPTSFAITSALSHSWALGLFLLRGWTTGWEEGENWGVGSTGDAVVLSAYPIQWREEWPVSPAGLIWTVETPEILRLWLKMFPPQSAAGASHVWHLSYGQVRSWCPTVLLNLGRLCRRRQVVFAGNVCPWVFYNFKADDSRH